MQMAWMWWEIATKKNSIINKEAQQRYLSKLFRLTKTCCNSTRNIMRMRKDFLHSTTRANLTESIHDHNETFAFDSQ